MAQPLGAVVAVVEAELTTPQRPTAECKGAEVMAEVAKAELQEEVAKAERQAEVAKVERQAEVAKVVLQVQAVAVVVKIRNCLKCLIPLSVMVTVSLTGAVLNLMAISVLLGHRPLLVQGAHVLKI